MKNNKLILISSFLLIIPSIFIAAYSEGNLSDSGVVTQRKITPKTPTQTVKKTNTTTQTTNKINTEKRKRLFTPIENAQRVLPDERWNNLRTTKVPGIYTLQGGQSVYFYNTEKKQMIEVPRSNYVTINTKNNKKIATAIPLPPIVSTKDLGEMEEEFKSHGNKTNMFRHEGKTYKIQAPENSSPNISTLQPSGIHKASAKTPMALPVTEWRSLRTTKVPGVFQREIGCGPCGEIIYKYYYYNKNTKRMVEIPKSYSPSPRYIYNSKTKQLLIYQDKPITSTKDLGPSENEFKLYGNKTNTLLYDGKYYTVPKPNDVTQNKQRTYRK